MRNDPRWRAGYKARDETWGAEHNPYPANSEHFAIWHDGWRTCDEDYNPIDNGEDVEAVEWDYSSPYCDGCAELGMSTCSCEPDGFEDE